VIKKETISALYIELLGRAPDKEGLEYWYNYAYTNNLNALTTALFNSAVENGEIQDPNDYNTLINNVYNNLLGRAPDKEGYNYWLSNLENGMQPSNFILAMYNAALLHPSDAQTLKAKAEAGIFMANANINDKNLLKFLINNIYSQDDLDILHKEIENINTNVNNIQVIQNYDDLSIEVKSLLIENGAKIDKDIVTYSFNQHIPDDYQKDCYTNNWHPLTKNDEDLVRKAFQSIEEFTNLQFKEIPYGGDIKFNKVDMAQNEEGFSVQSIQQNDNYVIKTDGVNADIFLSNQYDKLGLGYDTILHEIGHSLGLKHPFEDGQLMPIQKDNTLYTIMSYTQKNTFLPDIIIQDITPDTLTFNLHLSGIGRDNYAIYDMQALQFLYGTNLQNIQNNIYQLSDLYNQHQFYVINDNGGTDILDLSQTTQNNIIDLNPNSISYVEAHFPTEIIQQEISNEVQKYNLSDDISNQIFDNTMKALQNMDTSPIYQGEGNLSINNNSIIENYIGGDGADIIFDNSANNIIQTNNGDDIIYLTSQGNDVIDGGNGYDIVYLINDIEDYSIENHNTYVKVSTNDNDIICQNIEQIVFNNDILDLTS